MTGPDPVPSAVALKIDVDWHEAEASHHWELFLEDADGRPVLMETADGTQPVEVRGEFTVSQPQGIPEGSPIDVALAVNLGPIPLAPGTRFAWRLTIDGESLPGASLGFTTRPRRAAGGRVTVYDRPFGRYLEDFVPGDIYRHWPGKTITEYDDHLFCMITMNHHPLHTNAWFAEHETVQGKNVVVGNLVYSLALGMSVPDVSGSCIANLEVESLLHRSPTFHGDTIYAETRVLEATPVQVEGRPRHRDGGDEGLQPARRGGLLLPPQAHGLEDGAARRPAGAPTATTSGTEADGSRRAGRAASASACSTWGEQHRRDLPWRRTRDPWRILVSEVMLQQTQVDRVVPALRALRRRPSPRRPPAPRPGRPRWCAAGRGSATTAAPCNLHRAADDIVERHGGRVPGDDAASARPARRRRLHGAGGAVIRLRPRRGGRRHQRGAGAGPRRGRAARSTGPAAFALGDRLVPRGGSWEFNQTMFDLGATVCTAARPDCTRCPLRRQCAWRRAERRRRTRGAASPAARRQSAFAGRTARAGAACSRRCVDGDVGAPAIAAACGWPDDAARADRVAAALVDEGFARWSGRADPVLRLR